MYTIDLKLTEDQICEYHTSGIDYIENLTAKIRYEPNKYSGIHIKNFGKNSKVINAIKIWRSKKEP